ncbi:hypothetical protein [Roseomonas sp. USHLN139]|uniref:hypothetical protein n=1 Tax=Roseomonas sp. USHLN139 TaxID=3081298 RepID=UPI003B0279FE
MTAMAYSRRQLQKRRDDLEAGEAPAAAFAEMHDERVALVANALVPLRSADQAVEHIARLWKEAQDKFLAIGRYLVEAKRRFPKAYEREVVDRLPFGRQVAYQLATVARAVDAGTFQSGELPRTYSAAYLLTTLGDEALDQARQEGLVHPDVRRREIEAFKKALERQRQEALGRRALLLQQQAALKARVARLSESLEQAIAELKYVEKELGG